MIMVLAYLLIHSGSKPKIKDKLEIKINLDKTKLQNNEPISFSANLYSSKSRDCLLYYEIFNLDNVTIVSKQQEKIKLMETLTKKGIFSIENFSGGNYILRAKIKCDEHVEIATAKFTIIAEEEDSKNQKETKLIKNDTFEEIDNKNLQELKISEIIKVSKDDPTKAIAMCFSLNPKFSDNCILEIAEAAKNSELCFKIQEISIKDGCFLNFALKGNFSLCGYINDKYQKDGCNVLKLAGENEKIQ